MQTSARDAYLATQVTTATPQKLHLMLVEGAIRFLLQTEHHWSRAEEEEACEALLRSQEIVGEMLASVSSSSEPLARRLAAVYLFLMRTLSEVQLQHSETKLREVLRVLEIERETWAQVCAKFGAQVDAAAETKPAIAPPHAIAPPIETSSDFSSGGISFQA